MWTETVRPGSREQMGRLNSRHDIRRGHIPAWMEPKRKKTDARCYVAITFCWARPGQSPGVHKATEHRGHGRL